MASEIDICNLALGHLGDNATVASLDPPEGSAQAEHCARFYPIARDTLLQSHGWNFATRRIQLAQLGIAPTGWYFAYARPTDALDVFDIQFPDTQDYGRPTQAFICESDSLGNEVIYTNVQNAICRYVARVDDTTRFSPLFVTALTWHLAGMLAGPIIKGDAGAAESKRCAQMAQFYLAQAAHKDAQQRHIDQNHVPEWIAGSRSTLTNPWGR
jgi:hypothetical protein